MNLDDGLDFNFETDRFYTWSYYHNRYDEISSIDKFLEKHPNDYNTDDVINLARKIRLSSHPYVEYLSMDFFRHYRLSKLLIFYSKNSTPEKTYSGNVENNELELFRNYCKKFLHNKMRCIIWTKTNHEVLDESLWHVEWEKLHDPSLVYIDWHREKVFSYVLPWNKKSIHKFTLINQQKNEFDMISKWLQLVQENKIPIHFTKIETKKPKKLHKNISHLNTREYYNYVFNQKFNNSYDILVFHYNENDNKKNPEFFKGFKRAVDFIYARNPNIKILSFMFNFDKNAFPRTLVDDQEPCVTYWKPFENHPAFHLMIDGLKLHGKNWLYEAILRNIEKYYTFELDSKSIFNRNFEHMTDQIHWDSEQEDFTDL